VLATCGIAIPSFISSVVLLYTFGMNLKILPTVGLNEPAAYIMPVTALAIYPTAYITRLMRSSLLDVMGQDYMRTARAKGVSSVKILFKHALRNAILPVVTYVGPMLAGLMTGSFVVEKIFSIPGLGRDFVSAITNRDYTMIMGTTILLATLVIVANVIVDILYKVIDPRIKLTNGKSEKESVEPATQRRGLCPRIQRREKKPCRHARERQLLEGRPAPPAQKQDRHVQPGGHHPDCNFRLRAALFLALQLRAANQGQQQPGPV
jgi:ABC-type proline/glycine betaine transport system permease subunit